jgi:holo-[acyl-carrier protein] synthase
MIVGVGVDVVPVERFKAALQRSPGLRDRIFTPVERNLPIASLAARFAAKEAVAKALGAPAGMRWHDCEIGPGGNERPALRITGTVAVAAARVGAARWHLSLSHDGGMAVAMVVCEGG